MKSRSLSKEERKNLKAYIKYLEKAQDHCIYSCNEEELREMIKRASHDLLDDEVYGDD